MFMRMMAFLVRCYPPAFRAEFEPEILDVLNSRLAEARRSRRLQPLLIPIKELFGLFVSIPPLWLAAQRHKEPLMTVEDIPGPGYAPESRSHRPGSRIDALLSGLPHLLMGLVIGLGEFFPTASKTLISPISGVLEAVLVLFVCGVLLFAWRKGWPLWSASWYLYGTWVILAEISFAIDGLTRGDNWQYTSIVLLAWLAASAILYFRTYLRDPIKAMLSIAFFAPMFGVLMVDYAPGWIEGSLGIGLGLICAAAAAAIVRTGRYGLAWRLMVVVNIAAGLLNAYVGEYQVKNARPFGMVHVPSFANFLTALAYYLVFSFVLLFLPMGIWLAGNRKPAV